MKEVFARAGKALVVESRERRGQGSRRSFDKLAAFYRAQGERVGIIAVDPSSPIFGRRNSRRSYSHADPSSLDKEVFIRSMATRGNLGGLARGTVDAVAILDAAGYQKNPG
jgi:LAO/AO transport system kinase